MPEKQSEEKKAYAIPLRYIIAFLILTLIICYFLKEQALFEKLLMILVPFLIGTSVKLTYLLLFKSV
jgi:hypothetical protein